jgi:uncharacterized protein (TIGR02145 family)
MNIDGSNQVKITNNATTSSNYEIAGLDWTQDGQKIIYSAKISGKFNLYQVNVDGSGQSIFMSESIDLATPHVSLDGTRVYMMGNTPYNGYTSEIYSASITGNGLTKLTFDATGGTPDNSSRPAGGDFLVDGQTRILYARAIGDRHPQIFMMAPDGSGQTNLSSNDYAESWPATASNGDSAYVFSSNRNGSGLWLSDLSAGTLIQLTSDNDYAPDFWRGEISTSPPSGGNTPPDSGCNSSFEGTWTGTFYGQAVNMVLTEQGNSVSGTYDDGSGLLPISGTNNNGVFSFAIPNPEPGNSDCALWSLAGVATLDCDPSLMNLDLSGYVCSQSGGMYVSGNSVMSSGQTGTVTSATGRVWMDRNLGASRVATSVDDAAAYGDLYQWGRGTDGHEKRTSPTTTTLSSSDTPGHGSFILAPTSSYDWRNPQNDNLWQGVSGTNNPCPAGFRLPTNAEWQAERATWSTNDAASAFASPLKLVSAGNRVDDDGTINDAGSYGFYWSSSVNGSYARGLVFNSGNAGAHSSVRSYGISVRCIQD